MSLISINVIIVLLESTVYVGDGNLEDNGIGACGVDFQADSR